MEKHRIRIWFDVWIARLGSVFAWAWIAFWGLMTLASLSLLLDGQAEDTLEKMMPLICLLLTLLHWLLLRAARKTRLLVQDFRLYASVLAKDPDKSVSGLAQALGLPKEQVRDRLQEMCRRGYMDGHVEAGRDRLVFRERELVVARCPGCGAATAIYRTGDSCRYCGAPLQRPEPGNG